MDICVITYRNTPERVARALRPSDRLWSRDNTFANVGFATAANELAAQGTGEIIVFVNPDGDPDAACFGELERCFADPRVVAAEADQGPSWDDEWSAERYTWLSGACLAVRRSAFEQVGGFDTSLFMYAEDMDLSWRLAELGKLVHCDKAIFLHDRGERPFRSMLLESRNSLIVRHRWQRAERALYSELRGAGYALRTGQLRSGLARLLGSGSYLLWRSCHRFSPIHSLVTNSFATK